MSAMEKSLRRALEAGDATDPAFRESIYAASERALERMIAAKPVDEAAAHTQRTRLAETINRVEDDFYALQTAAGAAQDGPAQHDPELSLDPAYTDAHAYSTHPASAGDDRQAANGEAFELRPVFDDDERAGEGSGAARHTRAMSVVPAGETGRSGALGEQGVTEPVHTSPRAKAATAAREATQRSNAQLRRFGLIVLGVLVLLGIGAYLVYASTGGSEDSTAAAGDNRWIELFDGKRLDVLSTPNGGRMEALGEEGAGARPAVRFTPASGTSGISVAVGPGVLESIAGRKVVVEVAVGSPDGASRAFTVECRIGNEDVCGRQNFTTARPNETFLFDMQVPSGASQGGLTIVPGASATTGDSPLDVYAVRLRNA